MLVIVNQEASFKLDNSMLVVDGSYESGYVYDEDIFMVEGVKEDEWFEVGECSPCIPYFRSKVDWKVEEFENHWVHVERESYSSQEWLYTIYDDCGCVKWSFSYESHLTNLFVWQSYLAKQYDVGSISHISLDLSKEMEDDAFYNADDFSDIPF